jgi:hypothetical protein
LPAELATVFWGESYTFDFEHQLFAAFLGFGIFAGVTMGVLLMMDVLECFLRFVFIGLSSRTSSLPPMVSVCSLLLQADYQGVVRLKNKFEF